MLNCVPRPEQQPHVKPMTGTILITVSTECAESKSCSGPKHHYDECVERVTGQIEKDGKAKEDCVEECKHCTNHS